jgi:hypothetical protein
MSMKMFLVRHGFGRVLLHLGCLCRGGEAHFHMGHIRRQLKQAVHFSKSGYSGDGSLGSDLRRARPGRDSASRRAFKI